MNTITEYLERIPQVLKDQLGDAITLANVHPGYRPISGQTNLLQFSPVVFVSLLETLDTKSVDSGVAKPNLGMALYLLNTGDHAQEVEIKTQELSIEITRLLVGQKWGLPYTFPPRALRSCDLNWLTYHRKIERVRVGSPSLHSRALELFGGVELPEEQIISLWAIQWEQEIVLPEPTFEAQGFPHLLSLMETLDASLPNVPSVRLKDWELRNRRGGSLVLSGSVEVEPVDDSRVETYEIYWADHRGLRMGREKVAQILSKGPLRVPLAKELIVPQGATQLYAMARYSRGTSTVGATFPFTASTRLGSELEPDWKPLKGLSWKEDYWLLGISSIGLLKGAYFETSTQKWLTLNLPSLTITSLDSAVYYEGQVWLLIQDTSGLRILSIRPQSSDIVEFSGSLSLSLPLVGSLALGRQILLNEGVQGFSESLNLLELRLENGQLRTIRSSGEFATDELAPAPPPFQRKEMGMVSIGSLLYVMGGESLSEPFLDTSWAYDLILRTWRQVAPLPEGLKEFACLSWRGEIWVAGGSTSAGLSSQIFRFNPREDRWFQEGTLMTPRKSAILILIEGNLHVLGGIDSEDNELLSTEMFIPTSH